MAQAIDESQRANVIARPHPSGDGFDDRLGRRIIHREKNVSLGSRPAAKVERIGFAANARHPSLVTKRQPSFCTPRIGIVSR
jgi:hypothetical protein